MNKQQQRAAKIARQQQLVNAAKAANRSLTTEEQSEFDTLQREIDTLTAEIAAEEAQQQRQATGTNPEGTPAPIAPFMENLSNVLLNMAIASP